MDLSLKQGVDPSIARRTDMSATSTKFQILDKADLPDNYVNPYYLEDVKKRVSVACVQSKLYAFEDLCTHEGRPFSAGLE